MTLVIGLLAVAVWMVGNHALNVRHRNDQWKRWDAEREREEKRKKEGRSL